MSEMVSQLATALCFLPNKKAVRKPMKGVKSMSQIRGIYLKNNKQLIVNNFTAARYFYKKILKYKENSFKSSIFVQI